MKTLLKEGGRGTWKKTWAGMEKEPAFSFGRVEQQRLEVQKEEWDEKAGRQESEKRPEKETDREIELERLSGTRKGKQLSIRGCPSRAGQAPLDEVMAKTAQRSWTLGRNRLTPVTAEDETGPV